MRFFHSTSTKRPGTVFGTGFHFFWTSDRGKSHPCPMFRCDKKDNTPICHAPNQKITQKAVCGFFTVLQPKGLARFLGPVSTSFGPPIEANHTHAPCSGATKKIIPQSAMPLIKKSPKKRYAVFSQYFNQKAWHGFWDRFPLLLDLRSRQITPMPHVQVRQKR